MSKGVTNTRAVVSLFMLFGFITIIVTGGLSYVLRYNSLLSAIHTVFGLLFVAYGLFHLKNNLRPLFSYLKQAALRKWAWLAGLMIPLVLLSLALGLPPVQWLVDAGYALKELKPIDRQTTSVLYTQFDKGGRKLSVDIKAGRHYSGPGAKILGVTTTGIPQMAIWVEDLNGNYIETLYVTKKASNSSYLQGVLGTESARRPEALPHWSHSRGIRSADGLLMPSADEPIADALTGATPLASFELRSATVNASQFEKVVIKLEVNRSFDYNETYSKTAFPDDEVYSGSGNSAQPSLIYAATVDFSSESPYSFMSLIGRGHHSGKTGLVYDDLRGITTAKEIVGRGIVEVL